MTDNVLEQTGEGGVLSEEEQNKGEDFATLFEQSGQAALRLTPGEKVKCSVVGIAGDHVYVDLGGKSEGIIPLQEFQDGEGNYAVKAGDEVEAFFLAVEDGMRKLTTRVRGYSTVDLAGIRSARDAGLPVTGRVAAAVKGGFQVMVGKVRAFCPASQIDVRGGKDGQGYIGETYAFKVLDFTDDGSNVVLSRRAIIEEEKEMQIDRLKESLRVGQDVDAKVASIQNFGVFVDLGGIDGLIPLNEIAWGGVDNPSDFLTVGQAVTVRILALDWDRKRFTLSLKATQEDPWGGVEQRYAAGGKVEGKVVRLTPFGAFVNLEPGVDGLVHISRLGAGRRVKHPKEVVTVWQRVEAHIVEVDRANKRISLSLEGEKERGESSLPAEGEIVDGAVERVMPYGIFLRLNKFTVGLIPNAEMGTAPGTNHSRMFPPGTPLKAIVIEVNPESGRIRLSRTKMDERIEQVELEEYKKKVGEEEKSSGSLGSLGELLKDKLRNLS